MNFIPKFQKFLFQGFCIFISMSFIFANFFIFCIAYSFLLSNKKESQFKLFHTLNISSMSYYIPTFQDTHIPFQITRFWFATQQISISIVSLATSQNRIISLKTQHPSIHLCGIQKQTPSSLPQDISHIHTHTKTSWNL